MMMFNVMVMTMKQMNRTGVAFVGLLALLVLAACSSERPDAAPVQEADFGGSEENNFLFNNDDNNGGDADMGVDLGDQEDMGQYTPDVIIIEEDMEEPEDTRECRPELGDQNEPLKCFFYAHTDEGLYKIDPFTMTLDRVADAPRLFDIDTHPDGTLYGLGEDGLYEFDGNNTWTRLSTVAEIENATGLAIDRDGQAFVTAGESLWSVDLDNGRRRKVGDLGEDWFSSGDCVINKDNSLFMSSKAFDEDDTLVLIDPETGRANYFGDIGFRSVYGLTAGWSRMFGVTSRGELLELNVRNAQATLLGTFEGKRWFGAASTPAR